MFHHDLGIVILILEPCGLQRTASRANEFCLARDARDLCPTQLPASDYALIIKFSLAHSSKKAYFCTLNDFSVKVSSLVLATSISFSLLSMPIYFLPCL